MEGMVNRAELDSIIQWVKQDAKRLQRKYGRKAYGLALARASERFNVNRTQLARHSSKRGLAVRRKRAKQRKIRAETPRKPRDIQTTFGFEEKLNESLGIVKSPTKIICGHQEATEKLR